MQKGINFIPLEAIIGRVIDTLPKDSVGEDRILEWAYEAYEGIITNDVYEQHIDILTVQNHKAVIPSGFFSLNMVLHKRLEAASTSCATNTSSTVTTETSKEILNTTDSTTSITTTTVSTTPSTRITIPIVTGNPGDLKQTQLETYLKQPTGNEWMPLQLSSNTFHNGVLLSSHNQLPANVTGGCADSFNIKGGCIITTFQEGMLAISYNGIPKDDDDEATIPDLEYVKMALETYCLMRFWQWKFNMMQDGAQQRYRMYKQEWQLLAPKASGQLMMPTFMEYQNLRNINKFIKEDSPFANAMGSLNNQENFRFDNIRTNSFVSFT